MVAARPGEGSPWTTAGISPEVVERVLNFFTRTSDKANYVRPTRGAQGNALKTVLAIPYVPNGDLPITVTIEAQGLRHVITVATDKRGLCLTYMSQILTANLLQSMRYAPM